MSMKNKEESRKTKDVDREWSEKCRDWGSKKPRKPETLEKTYKNAIPRGGPKHQTQDEEETEIRK